MIPVRQQLIGKSFIHPVADYIMIGGAWSIIVIAAFLARPDLVAGMNTAAFGVLILLLPVAHFAASTLRLYSKPSYYKEFPFLAFAFPVITLAVLSVCILSPTVTGRYLVALYLTWSPFHYAKQTYGLSLMYSYRSGVKLTDPEKRLVYWTCMMPFLHSLLGSPELVLMWGIPSETLAALPDLRRALDLGAQAFLVLTFLVPALLFYRIFQTRRQFLPLITVLIMVTNGLWWTTLPYIDAFILATLAHGLQYNAITTIYHVRERLRDAANRHGWFYHAALFYGGCVLLGFGLFYCWPYAFVWAGAGLAESMLLVIATINLHHFIVDAYIWRLRSPSNAPTLVDPPGTPTLA
jgi:hypothetical protein